MADRPAVWPWFRAWCGLMVLIYLGIVVAGGALALHCLERPSLGPDAAVFLGGAPIVAGLIGATFHGGLIFVPRRPWGWTAGLVGLVLGCLSTCPPLALPLLIFWLRDDARAFFGRDAA